MAIINPIHGPMSGSVGGNVYSHNRGGPYVRYRGIPVQPNSPSQTAARARLSTVSTSWQSLTTAEQNQWSDWAALHPVTNALGVSIFLSGANAYVALSTRAILYGGAIITTPPAVPVPPGITLAVATLTGNSAVINFDGGPTAATDRLVIWATMPMSPGRNPNVRQARFAAVGPLADASPTTILIPVPALPGQLVVFYIAVGGEDGQQSPYIRADAIGL